jgi:hypothetical protein
LRSASVGVGQCQSVRWDRIDKLLLLFVAALQRVLDLVLFCSRRWQKLEAIVLAKFAAFDLPTDGNCASDPPFLARTLLLMIVIVKCYFALSEKAFKSRFWQLLLLVAKMLLQLHNEAHFGSEEHLG